MVTSQLQLQIHVKYWGLEVLCVYDMRHLLFGYSSVFLAFINAAYL